jgi:hypothetical protein
MTTVRLDEQSPLGGSFNPNHRVAGAARLRQLASSAK